MLKKLHLIKQNFIKFVKKKLSFSKEQKHQILLQTFLSNKIKILLTIF